MALAVEGCEVVAPGVNPRWAVCPIIGITAVKLADIALINNMFRTDAFIIVLILESYKYISLSLIIYFFDLKSARKFNQQEKCSKYT